MLLTGPAFVTGAGSGIGRGVAIALAEHGVAVAACDVDEAAVTSTVADITASGQQARAITADVSCVDAVMAAVDAAESAFGPPMIVVNAAGILDGFALVEKQTVESWQRVIAVNLTGTFLVCKRVIGAMAERGSGRIVNFASVAGLTGRGGGAAYVASKHGVVGLTRALCGQYAARGVTVNAVCPGAIRTAIVEHAVTTFGVAAVAQELNVLSTDEGLRLSVPAALRGTVSQVVASVLFLTSDAASYINGAALAVDGGWAAV